MYVRPRSLLANEETVPSLVGGNKCLSTFGSPFTLLPTVTHSTAIDISERSPISLQWYCTSLSTTPISKVLRPCTLSITSDTVPSRIDAPLSMRRVDHSCSRIVWCRSTNAWRIDDLPEALGPDSSVNGPRGRRSSSKHL